MAGNRSVFYEKEGALVCFFDNETVMVEPWGADSLRIRATKENAFTPYDWALLEKEPCSAVIDLELEGGGASISNGRIKAVFDRTGFLQIFNQNGKPLLKEYSRNRLDLKSPNCSALEMEAREFKPIIGGDYMLGARFESISEDEKIFGMGQYQQPYLNLKGTVLELAHRNSQASVPFYVSSLGYGFLWNNPAIGRVAFGKNVTFFEAFSTKQLDYWITAGDSPSEIEERYASVTGKVSMMPDYGLGFWQSKQRYRTQEELLEAARGYKERGVPVSVIICDFFHWPMQGEWRFDPVYWPDPVAMVEELNEMGMELMVSIWPTVDYRSRNFEEMLKHGYLIRVEKGFRLSMVYMGNTLHYDATNPGARGYVWSKIRENYYDKGIKAFWLDEAEPEYAVYDFENYRYYLGPNLQIGNIFPAMYSKTFYDGMSGEGQENIVNLVRSAWAGSQRYGALVWSGDIPSSFAALRNQFAAGLGMGMAGIPWWTSDIGGFIGGEVDDPSFHELLVRWFEFGLFCPVMRLHGEREPHKPQLGTTGGAPCVSGADNEIWCFGEKVEKILTGYIHMRESMKPYLREIMAQAHEKGTPLMRPLFYDFPKDDRAWDEHLEEYMFGPDILVAPVMHEGMEKRSVYLPKGCTWTFYWTKEVSGGGCVVEVDAPLDRIPFFLRNGRSVL